MLNLLPIPLIDLVIKNKGDWNSGTMNNVTVKDNEAYTGEPTNGVGNGKIVAGEITWAYPPAHDEYFTTSAKTFFEFGGWSPPEQMVTDINDFPTVWLDGAGYGGSSQFGYAEYYYSTCAFGKGSAGEQKNVKISTEGASAGLFKVGRDIGGGFTGNSGSEEAITVEFLDGPNGTVLGGISGEISSTNLEIIGILPAGTKYANFTAAGCGDSVQMYKDMAGGHIPYINIAPDNNYFYSPGPHGYYLSWGWWGGGFTFQIGTSASWVYPYDFGVAMNHALTKNIGGATAVWIDNSHLKITKTFVTTGEECTYIRIDAKEAKN
jgi:hypothetical protein